jgi:RNA polymerase sigma-70 factor (ECF subfamily)
MKDDATQPGSEGKHDARHLLAHAGPLRALALRLACDADEADDLLQETWVVALEHPPRANWHPGRWLAGVLRRRFRERRRAEARRRRREAAAARAESLTGGMERTLERAEVFRRAVTQLLALDPKYRDVVLLRYFEGLPIQEIARRERIPVETARTRLRRALDLLCARLDEEPGGRLGWTALLLEAPAERALETTAPLRAARTPNLIRLAGGIPVTAKQSLACAALALAITAALAGLILEGVPPAAEREAAPRLAATAPGARPETRGASQAAPVAAGEAARPAGDADESPAAGAADGSSAALRGTVRDEDGMPVPRASIEALRVVRPDPFQPELAAEGRTESGLRGDFALEPLPPGEYIVRVTAADHRPQAADGVELEPGGLAELEIELRRGLAIEGRVVDPLGRPVARAQVEASSELPRAGAFRAGITRGEEVWLRDTLRVESGEDGRFRLTRLASGNRRLVVRHAEWAPAVIESIAAGSREVLVAMEPAAGLEGRVLSSAGLPVARALVTVYPRTEQFVLGGLRLEASGRADELGRFALGGLSPGVLVVTAAAEDHPRKVELATVRKGETLGGFEMVLAEPAALRGAGRRARRRPGAGEGRDRAAGRRRIAGPHAGDRRRGPLRRRRAGARRGALGRGLPGGLPELEARAPRRGARRARPRRPGARAGARARRPRRGSAGAAGRRGQDHGGASRTRALDEDRRERGHGYPRSFPPRGPRGERAQGAGPGRRLRPAQ